MVSHGARIQASFPAASWDLTVKWHHHLCLMPRVPVVLSSCVLGRSREGRGAAPDFILNVLLWGEGLLIMYHVH